MIKFLILVIVISFFSTINHVTAAQSILISYSDEMHNVIFDGKWSHTNEWKQSSWDVISGSGSNGIHLRSAHQDNFIYILLDVTVDQTIDYVLDRAVVCFDVNNDKSSIPGEDDYCFMSALYGKQAFAYQGGSPLALKNNFKQISNPDGFIGIAIASDMHDRYSKIPHASYEFRIPTDLIGRSNNYGFYVYVFDASEKTFYTWPSNAVPSTPLDIPSPNTWGNLISPDNSIPEFEWPILILMPAFCLIIYLTKIKHRYW